MGNSGNNRASTSVLWARARPDSMPQGSGQGIEKEQLAATDALAFVLEARGRLAVTRQQPAGFG